jgi:hypothetical protein
MIRGEGDDGSRCGAAPRGWLGRRAALDAAVAEKPLPFRVVCIDDHAYLSADAGGNPRTPGPDERLTVSLTIGKVYEVVGERLGMYGIVDDTGGKYLFPKSRFRVLSK